MIDNRETLFRKEALEFRTRSEETPGTVVRLGPRWLRWSYRLALALVGVGVALAILLRTTTTTSGMAVVNGRQRTFAALLPALVAPQLQHAKAIHLELASPDGSRLGVRVTSAMPVAAGAAVPGLPRPDQPAIVLRGRVLPVRDSAKLTAKAGLAARAIVDLRTERLGEVVLRQLKTTFTGKASG